MVRRSGLVPLATAAWLLCPCLGIATTLPVRSDGLGAYATIQSAMNAAAPGDTILLADGVYRGAGNRDLDPQGKSLVVRSSSNSPRECVIDCESAPDDPHRGFFFHGGETVMVAGLTVQGGGGSTPSSQDLPGAAVLCGDVYADQPWLHTAHATLQNCLFTRGQRGPTVQVSIDSSIHCRSCTFMENEGAGFSDFMIQASSVLLEDCLFNSHAGDGASIYFYGGDHGALVIRGCTFLNNAGNGLVLGLDLIGVRVEDCVFQGNGGNGIRVNSVANSRLEFVDCEILDNAGVGVSAGIEPTALILQSCRVARNGLGGVALLNSDGAFSDTEVTDNGGDGVFLDELADGSVTVQHSRLTGNRGAGLRVATMREPSVGATRRRVALSRSLLCGNDSAGVHIRSGAQPTTGFISTCTIAGNGAEAIFATGLDSLLIDHSILAHNDGAGAFVDSNASLDVGCTDIYGNGDGDWEGALAPWLGNTGSICADPLFCASDLASYSLHAGSPCCTPASGACGQIGALAAECGLTGVIDPNSSAGALHLAAAPNPFNPRTTVRFELPSAGLVRLAVLDLSGRLVCTLVDSDLPAGAHEAAWDGRDSKGRNMGSGSYLARLQAGARSCTTRMILVR